MEIVLNNTHRLVAQAASKDDSRPVLQCVHIADGMIEASNGWVAIQKDLDYHGEEVLINVKDLAKCKASKNLSLMLLKEGDVIKVVGSLLTFGAQNGSFPKVEKLYPDRGNCVFKIALSRKELLNVLKALSDEEDAIKFYFYNKTSPVEFTVGENEETTGLIMPMSVNWETRSQIEVEDALRREEGKPPKERLSPEEAAYEVKGDQMKGDQMKGGETNGTEDQGE